MKNFDKFHVVCTVDMFDFIRIYEKMLQRKTAVPRWQWRVTSDAWMPTFVLEGFTYSVPMFYDEEVFDAW